MSMRAALRRRRRADADVAVFAAYWYRGCACNPRAIYEKARELLPDLRAVWVVKRRHVHAMPPDVEYVHPRSAEYEDLIARARYFVNNVNFPDHFSKRPGSVHVMTHHGTPLKRMGLDLQGRPEKPLDVDALLRRVARWDFSISANAYSTAIWERVLPGDYETLETGYPRNDVLATATPAGVARARDELGIDPATKVVLYAPTHREYLQGEPALIDLARVAAGLGDGWLVLARSHYLQAGHAAPAGIRDVSQHPSVERLYLAADALLTDYSSTMFDYAVLDRPIVIHAADWEEYSRRRGTYFDVTAEAPGAVARSEAEVVAALLAGDSEPAARAAFRARFCALDDGSAAERVVRAVFR